LSTDESIAFSSSPFICGAIGEWTDDALHQLLAAAPGDLTALPFGPHIRFYSSSTAQVKRSTSGYSWAAAADNGRSDLLSATVRWDGSRASVQTDAFGLHEIYYRRIGAAVFFSSRIAPLLAIDGGLVAPDWEAWADILAFGYPIGDKTPFLEVKRMSAGTSWRTRDGAVLELQTTPWQLIPSGPPAPAQSIAALVTRNIPRFSWRRPNVLLSGGWDSRLLAGLMRSKSLLRPTAWTTSPDDGRDHDIALSRPVAEGLKLAHRVHTPGDEAYTEHATATRRRVQYQTNMHTWLSPLAELLRHEHGPLLDGLAGDVLLKSLFVSSEVGATRERTKRMALVRDRLSTSLDNEAVFRPEVAEFVRGATRAGFERATEYLPEMPGDATLAVLLTRTMRGIAPSPLWIFGPESDVRLPFMDPAVIEAALTVPIDTKSGGDYYRQVLSEACPRVASLPSTNDPLPKMPPAPRRQASQRALASMARSIRDSDAALGLLTPRMAQAVLEGDEDLLRLGQFNAPLRMLQIASLLAEWQEDFSAVLDTARPPWAD
jgi:hypothetical protein